MKHRILLVDDEPEMLNLLGKILRDYQVFKAGSVQDALALLSKEVVHLIISDVMMDEIDGFQFCQLIKSNIEYSHVPLLLLTAKDGLNSKIAGLKVGADAYIEKPFSADYLIAQINSLLSNRDRIKESFVKSPLSLINNLGSSKIDEQFLQSVEAIVNDNIDNEQLGVELIADTLNMSRVTLYRKIVSITSVAPIEFINLVRLKKAAAILATKKYKINEVASMVGYLTQSNFARSFYKQFKTTPREYIKSISTL